MKPIHRLHWLRRKQETKTIRGDEKNWLKIFLLIGFIHYLSAFDGFVHKSVAYFQPVTQPFRRVNQQIQRQSQLELPSDFVSLLILTAFIRHHDQQVYV